MSKLGKKFLEKAEEITDKYEAILGDGDRKIPVFNENINDEKLNLFIITDAHIGSKEADLRLLKEYIGKIEQTPNAVVVVLGDLLDMALKNSRSDIYDAAISPSDQVMSAIHLLDPIKEKIAVIVRGNHEYRADKETGTNPLLSINLALGLEDKYAKDSFVLVLNNSKNEKFTIFGSHGSGLGGARETNVLRNAIRISNNSINHADMYLYGHRHISGYFEENVNIMRNNKVQKSVRRICIEPAFMVGGGYAEMYNYKTPALQHHYFEVEFIKGVPSLSMFDFVPSYEKTRRRKTAYQKEVENKQKLEQEKTMGKGR